MRTSAESTHSSARPKPHARVQAPTSLIEFDFSNSAVNKNLIATYEEHPEKWQTGQLLLVGLCYVAERRLDEGERVFEQILKDAPDGQVLRCIGCVNVEKGNIDKAEHYLRLAWEQDGDYKALKQLTISLMQAKGPAAVDHLVEELLPFLGQDVEIRKALLAYSVLTDDLAKGQRIFKAVVLHRATKGPVGDAEEDTLLDAATRKYEPSPVRGNSGSGTNASDKTQQ